MDELQKKIDVCNEIDKFVVKILKILVLTFLSLVLLIIVMMISGLSLISMSELWSGFKNLMQIFIMTRYYALFGLGVFPVYYYFSLRARGKEVSSDFNKIKFPFGSIIKVLLSYIFLAVFISTFNLFIYLLKIDPENQLMSATYVSYILFTFALPIYIFHFIYLKQICLIGINTIKKHPDDLGVFLKIHGYIDNFQLPNVSVTTSHRNDSSGEQSNRQHLPDDSKGEGGGFSGGGSSGKW